LQIERYYTKEQIMEMYCNYIFLGGGAYGFEAAAQYYFSKSLKDLTLEESALLAGLPKAPSLYSPTRDEKAALERRNVVLYRMHEEGYINNDEYNRAGKPESISTSVLLRTPTTRSSVTSLNLCDRSRRDLWDLADSDRWNEYLYNDRSGCPARGGASSAQGLARV